MAREFLVDALGERVRVTVEGMPDSDAGRLEDQWRRLSTAGEATSALTVAGSPGIGAEVTGRDLDEVAVALRRAINLRAIEATRGELLVLHAAGLADPATGDVIALVGPSGAGKSTAAATLGTALGYVSDETVAVTPGGDVLPFPQPLAFKLPGGGKRVQGPDELGLLRAGPRLRLSCVALLDRTDAVTVPEVEPVGLGEVVADLVGQVNYFDALPRPLSALDALVRRCGGVHVIRYREAADLLGPVRALLGATAGAPLYSRVEADDAVALDSGAAVLAAGRITVLTPLSALLWGLLVVPQPLPRLVAAAEREFGPAPDGGGEAAVRAVLGELADAGLVRPPRSGRHRARD
ncbi:hypothetical protein [Leifsonia shinshuensis]|uniref:Energy-coupling factor transporter ATP-binding protein EcfA2 n=1 Tax=Leifsonia shinshuensis TaxID=150026 RepID=A0A853CW70_9MICO|nr:hypothetical protein [Leifsonia shinshuensis]NYJ25366.1 energy-coupling factor transporter ATP-binding protein EcfA2 [Leifsonia shinshuensis]